MDRDKFNVNRIIEESILEVQESDKGIEEIDDKGLITESLDPVVSHSFLGDFDIQANFEALNGLGKTIHGLPRVKDASKLFEDAEYARASTFNRESDEEITEGVKRFIKGEKGNTSFIIPESAGLASGLGALTFAKKLRRY